MRLRARLVAALGLLLIAGCGVRAQDKPQRLTDSGSTLTPVPSLKASICPTASPPPAPIGPTDAPSAPLAPLTSSDAGACSTVASTG